jgi:transcriptional regulator with XRE-family HTH domain
LDDAGLAQRQIAALTGQTRSEVSEVLRRRQVIAYEVLERIATGLGIFRERMGLSWWGPGGIWYCAPR